MEMGMGSDGSGTVTILVAVGTFLLTLAGSLLVAGWRGRGIQAKLEKQISDQAADHETKTLRLAAELRAETEKRFETARRDRSAEIDLAGRAYGEVANALRQKIHEVETWSRDNFVREQVFQNFLESLTKSNENLRADMNSNYQQLNKKLDDFILAMSRRDQDAR
jgi:hypothetical protein